MSDDHHPTDINQKSSVGEGEESHGHGIGNQRKRASPSPSPTDESNKSQPKSSGPPNKQRKTKVSPANGSTSGDSKANRGLRHFSMMVCKKVEEKGTTTYNEVADELVRKVIEERRREDPNGKFDEKNIRRRVYDALNVLMAMDIISKEKKEITWKGLPRTAPRDLDSMGQEVEFRRGQIARKREALRELLVQQVCFRNLVLHNQQRGPSDEKIPLPFIVVNTNSSAVIQCDMSRDRTDVMFDFSMPFEINDDNTILKKMEMDKTSHSVLRQMLPEDMMSYCQDHGLLDNIVGKEEELQAQPPHDSSPPPPPPHHPHHSHPSTSGLSAQHRPENSYYSSSRGHPPKSYYHHDDHYYAPPPQRHPHHQRPDSNHRGRGSEYDRHYHPSHGHMG